MTDAVAHDGPETQEKEAEKPVDPAAAKQRKRRALLILAVVFAVVAIIGLILWLDARHYESTDDAFIDGYISQVAPQVAGPVTKLLVTDNEEVKTGQILFEIDPRDEQVRLAQAKAQEAQAQAAVEKSRSDLRRYQQTDIRAISRQQLDAATAQADSDTASLQAAQANVANAALQLSYTQVRAPQAGRITRRTVNVGNYLTPGQPALAIVSDQLWVTANFKETQLDHMRIGQKVAIEVDAYPDADITGHIDSLQSGSGSVFSSLPAENATGNFVKIVQRVPVKIVIDRIEHADNQVVRLAPGLSVRPKVTVR